MDTVTAPFSVSFTLAVAGVILMAIGISALICAMLFVLNYIEWPWPINLLDPEQLGTFSLYLVYAGFAVLALGVLVEMAASFL
jgi:hypothetical protein